MAQKTLLKEVVDLTDINEKYSFRRKFIVLSAEGHPSYVQFKEAKFWSVAKVFPDNKVTIHDEDHGILAQYWPRWLNMTMTHDILNSIEYSCTAFYSEMLKEGEVTARSTSVHSTLDSTPVVRDGIAYYEVVTTIKVEQ